jgi:hypothetical protein
VGSIVYADKYVASQGVDKELTQKLANFYADQRRWINNRRNQIRDARAEIEAERLRREREEQEAREAAEHERGLKGKQPSVKERGLKEKQPSVRKGSVSNEKRGRENV